LSVAVDTESHAAAGTGLFADAEFGLMLGQAKWGTLEDPEEGGAAEPPGTGWGFPLDSCSLVGSAGAKISYRGARRLQKRHRRAKTLRVEEGKKWEGNCSSTGTRRHCARMASSRGLPIIPRLMSGHC
jgi:hypothetical protein